MPNSKGDNKFGNNVAYANMFDNKWLKLAHVHDISAVRGLDGYHNNVTIISISIGR